MLTLLELLFLLFITPIHNYVTLTTAASTSIGDPCRMARSLEPLITVGLIDGSLGFCPTSITPAKQCCSDKAWTTLFPQSWTRLANPFNTKLVNMEIGLRKGIEDVKGMNCPSGSTLQATTLSALSQLGTNKWVSLINTTTSPECRLKVVQSVICPGVCEPNMQFRLPCRNLCINTLRGCVGDLSMLASSWKHAMNSVRTAVRLLATTVNSGCSNPSVVDSLLHSISTWREPLTWLDSGCEELPQDNCYNGRDVSTYTKGVSPLGSSSNPEFPFSERPPGGVIRAEIHEFKILLDSITEALSHHWPKLPQETESSTSDQIISDEFGSGGGGSRRFLHTDDEDLLESSEFGSGSGDGEGEGGDFGKDLSHDIDDDLYHSSHPNTVVPPLDNTIDSSPPSTATTGGSSKTQSLSFVFLFGATILLSFSQRTLQLS